MADFSGDIVTGTPTAAFEAFSGDGLTAYPTLAIVSIRGDIPPGSGATGALAATCYAMRGNDPGPVTQPTYRVWIVVGFPDFSGVQYTGAGAGTLTGITVAASWIAGT